MFTKLSDQSLLNHKASEYIFKNLRYMEFYKMVNSSIGKDQQLTYFMMKL